MNKLFYGDNLDVLRESIASESVDLVYLDPPFNSNRSYNVIFGKDARAGNGASAQIQAFDDTWHWTPVTDQQYHRYALTGELPARVADALTAFRTLLGENDAMAYLVNMAPRLVELRRVLRPSGSIYLHCDPIMSHYLKVLLDAIFGAVVFRNEVAWKRTGAHNSAKRWGPVHDVILFYTKGTSYNWNRTYQVYDASYVAEKFTFTDERGPYQPVSLSGPGLRTGDSGQPWRGFNPSDEGRHWQPPSMMYNYYEALAGRSLAALPIQERLDKADELGLIYWPTEKKDGKPRFKQYLHISPGMPLQDIISDIPAVNSVAKERLGYPTQKPVALLERILSASSNPGDMVLDPFCGCGTTVDAAQRLGRQWTGIDITYIAIDLIDKRLRDSFPGSEKTYEILGIPRDMASAQSLFDRSPFDFERWAVSRINAQPNLKQVGDKGVDGVARFYLNKKTNGRILVSVKGGKTVGPQYVRDLIGTVETQKAQMGVLITITEPTQGVLDAVNHGGVYTWPVNGQVYPRVQVITVADLLHGRRPNMPPPILPYVQAARAEQPTSSQMTLYGETATM